MHPMKRLLVTLAILLSSLVAVAPPADAYLNSCTTYWNSTAAKSMCNNQVNGGPSDPYPLNQQRAWVRCTDGTVRYGPWVGKGVWSNANCVWTATLTSYGYQRR